VLLAYVLSFILIGIYWNNHHHMLAAATRISGMTLWAALPVSADDAVSMARVRFRNRRGRRALPGWAAP
jgi:hypothetical protein